MRNLFCLNGEWDFMPLYDQPQCRSLPETIVYEECKVLVPSSWRRTYPQPDGKTFGKIPEYDYAPFDLYGYPEEWDSAESGVLHRSFRVPESMAGQRIVLRLDGIMQKAVIYIDGQEAGIWEDGYLPLRLDITSMVEQGREHQLQVVCSSFDTVLLPNGTSKITGLMGSWYGRISRGIWQDVYLEGYPVLALEDVTIRTSVREGRLEVQAVAAGAEEAAAGRGPLKVRLSVWEKVVLRRGENGAEGPDVRGIDEHTGEPEGLKELNELGAGEYRELLPVRSCPWKIRLSLQMRRLPGSSDFVRTRRTELYTAPPSSWIGTVPGCGVRISRFSTLRCWSCWRARRLLTVTLRILASANFGAKGRSLC